MAEGGFAGAPLSNQGFFQPPGQQQQRQQAAFGNQQLGGYGNMMGGLQQQLDSAGPFAAQASMQAGSSMQGPLSSIASRDGQQQQHGQGDPQSQAAMWQQAFFKLAAAAGVPVDPSQGAQAPEAVIQQAQAARQRDPWVQAQARDAAMQVQVAMLTAQNIHLRRELASGWAAADSNLIQVQQLILDPAIEHEFKHLRAQLAMRVAETEAAKAAYEGQAFTADSKMGHALLRKVKVLTEENEDLGRQQRESKQAAQGAIAAVERRHADELREELQDTRDLCALYQQENEELNMVSLLYQRQLETLKQRAAAAPAPAPHRDYGRERLPAAQDQRQSRPVSRDRDRDRQQAPPRDKSPGLRDRTAERARDSRAAAEGSRGRGADGGVWAAGARDRRGGLDMDTRGGRGGYSGGRHDTRGEGQFGRGRGRNLTQQYSGKRPR